MSLESQLSAQWVTLAFCSAAQWKESPLEMPGFFFFLKNNLWPDTEQEMLLLNFLMLIWVRGCWRGGCPDGHVCGEEGGENPHGTEPTTTSAGASMLPWGCTTALKPFSTNMKYETICIKMLKCRICLKEHQSAMTDNQRGSWVSVSVFSPARLFTSI